MSNLATGSDCYLLTGRGAVMPGTVAGIDYRGLVAVKSPSGSVYTCNPNNVFDAPTGRVMLMHARAEQMAAQGYQIAVRPTSRTFRVYQTKKHGTDGGWIVTRGTNSLTCNCPAHAKELTCKHVMAVCSLLIRRADRLRAAGKLSVATRYTNLAGVIHEAA